LQEERHVRADRGRDLEERPRVADPERLREAAEHGGRVGRSPAQAGRHGDALLDADGHRAAHAEALPERLGGLEREVGRTVELGPARDGAGDRAGPRADPHLHAIGEVERDHEGGDLVEPVGAERAHAQDEIHLGGRGREEAHLQAVARPAPRGAGGL